MNALREIITWHHAYLAGLWFVVGALLASTGRLTLPVTVPILIGGLPLAVAIGEGGGLTTLPFGGDILAYIEGIGLPLVASVAGGHAGLAVHPVNRARCRAELAWNRARERAEHVAAEIATIQDAYRSYAERRVAGQTSEASDRTDLHVMRLQLAQRQNELREIGTALSHRHSA